VYNANNYELSRKFQQKTDDLDRQIAIVQNKHRPYMGISLKEFIYQVGGQKGIDNALEKESN
jgi:hypothetical protein